jgi:hypothetical protein
MSGRVINLKAISGAERKPLSLQHCAMGQHHRLSVKLESSAAG